MKIFSMGSKKGCYRKEKSNVFTTSHFKSFAYSTNKPHAKGGVSASFFLEKKSIY